jgi:hypothetical protein
MSDIWDWYQRYKLVSFAGIDGTSLWDLVCGDWGINGLRIGWKMDHQGIRLSASGSRRLQGRCNGTETTQASFDVLDDFFSKIGRLGEVVEIGEGVVFEPE